jgi:hypothetical protein
MKESEGRIEESEVKGVHVEPLEIILKLNIEVS